MRSKFWYYLIDNTGAPLTSATIHVYAYPLGGGTATYANVYLTDGGAITTTYDTPLASDSDGYFEFWVGDKEESGTYGYEYQREFKITWSAPGAISGSIDKIQLFDVTKREVDPTSSGTYKNRLVSNILAKRWEDHRTDVTDDHLQYLKTDGSRSLTANWNLGNYKITLAELEAYGSAIEITSRINTRDVIYCYDDLLMQGSAQIMTGPGTILTGGDILVGGKIDGPTAYFDDLTITGGTLLLDGSSVLQTGTGLILTGGNFLGGGWFYTGGYIRTNAYLTVGTSATIGTDLIVGGSFINNDVDIGGGYIDGVTIGQTVAYPGYFSTLSVAGTMTVGGWYPLNLETENFSAKTIYSETTVKCGTLTVSGNTTLGDAAGDSLTITGTAISTPNNLNFDSNTLFIDAASNKVIVGSTASTRKFEVLDTSIQMRLRYDGSNYADFEVTSGGKLRLDSSGNEVIVSDANLNPNTYRGTSLGSTSKSYNYFYTYELSAGKVNAGLRGIVSDGDVWIQNNKSLWFSGSGDIWFGSGGIWGGPNTIVQVGDIYCRTVWASGGHITTDGWLLLGAEQVDDPKSPLDIRYDTLRLSVPRSPASTSPGVSGEICWDTDNIYICTADNTWKKASLTGGY